MSLTVTKQTASSSAFSIALQVDMVSTSLVVRAGSIQVRGQTFNLTEDEVFQVSAEPQDRSLLASLILVSGELRVLVEELVLGEDSPPFDFAASGYELLHRLYSARIPPNSQVSESEITVYHIVQPSPVSKAVAGQRNAS